MECHRHWRAGSPPGISFRLLLIGRERRQPASFSYASRRRDRARYATELAVQSTQRLHQLQHSVELQPCHADLAWQEHSEEPGVVAGDVARVVARVEHALSYHHARVGGVARARKIREVH